MLTVQGIWDLDGDRQAGIELKHIQSQISSDLSLRQHLLQDADGHVAQISDQLQLSIRNWTELEATEILKIGQDDTYIIDCRNLHSLTSLILKRAFQRADENDLIAVGFES